jgi:hypothetical protein
MMAQKTGNSGRMKSAQSTHDEVAMLRSPYICCCSNIAFKLPPQPFGTHITTTAKKTPLLSLARTRTGPRRSTPKTSSGGQPGRKQRAGLATTFDLLLLQRQVGVTPQPFGTHITAAAKKITPPKPSPHQNRAAQKHTKDIQRRATRPQTASGPCRRFRCFAFVRSLGQV